MLLVFVSFVVVFASFVVVFVSFCCQGKGQMGALLFKVGKKVLACSSLARFGVGWVTTVTS